MNTYNYQCRACEKVFPDKQSWKAHLTNNYGNAIDKAHIKTTYSRLNAQGPGLDARAYTKTLTGYSCPNCGLKSNAKIDIIKHTCPARKPKPPLDFTKLEKLTLSVNQFIRKVEDCDYHPELHLAHKPASRRERKKFLMWAEKLIDRPYASYTERSPLQQMSYAYHLKNWERVKSAAYMLAYDLVQKEKERILRLIMQYPGLVYEPGQIVAFVCKDDLITQELGPEDNTRPRSPGVN